MRNVAVYTRHLILLKLIPRAKNAKNKTSIQTCNIKSVY